MTHRASERRECDKKSRGEKDACKLKIVIDENFLRVKNKKQRAAECD